MNRTGDAGLNALSQQPIRAADIQPSLYPLRDTKPLDTAPDRANALLKAMFYRGRV